MLDPQDARRDRTGCVVSSTKDADGRIDRGMGECAKSRSRLFAARRLDVAPGVLTSARIAEAFPRPLQRRGRGVNITLGCRRFGVERGPFLERDLIRRRESGDERPTFLDLPGALTTEAVPVSVSE